jgi:peptidoglycan/LPS O-acetylase OafA/YrhL
LIGGRLLEASDQRQGLAAGLKNFYARRALRILPAYYDSTGAPF